MLHMSDKVTDGSAVGMAYNDANANPKFKINYGKFRFKPLEVCTCYGAVFMLLGRPRLFLYGNGPDTMQRKCDHCHLL
jgi:hypothetical protein